MQELRHENNHLNKEICAYLYYEIETIYDQFWEHYIEHPT